MAQGKRNGGHSSARVASALDACVRRMRQGESLQRCLADHSELATVLEPLLSVAQALSEPIDEQTNGTAPPPPHGLQPGRARLLAAAAALREQGQEAGAARTVNGTDAAPHLASPRERAEALDLALAAKRSVHSEGRVEEQASPAPSDSQLDELTHLAEQIRRRTVAAPSLDAAALERGRARMLAAAEQMQVRRATEATAPAESAAPSPSPDAEVFASKELLEALDVALDGVARGRSRHDMLQSHREQPELAAAMAPLLEVATHVRQARTEIPDPAPALERARDRFLALAAAARGVAEAAGTLDVAAGATEAPRQTLPATAPAQHQWLDAAWAAMAAGASRDEALARCGAPAAEWADLRPLLDLAAQARAEAVPVAAPAGQPGRARMLAVAAEARERRQARAEANTRARRTRREAAWAGWLATLRGFLGGGLAAGPRAALLSLCILLGLVGVNALAYPAYATTLPGEPLYAMKRLARSTRLAVAGALAPVSPARAADWRTQIERDRVAEVVQLQDDGRNEVADLPGRFAGFESQGEGDDRRGTIHVAVDPDKPEDTPALVIVDWNGKTAFSLPNAYGTMDAVPRGAPVSVRVRTGDARPLALRVRVGLLAPLEVLTGTATMTATPDPDETPDPRPPATSTAGATGTATVGATATLSITQTPLPSPTLMATATITVPTATATPILTPTLAAMPTATPGGPGNGQGGSLARPSFLVLRGSVLALDYDDDSARWVLVLRVDDNPDDERKIDVTALANDKGLSNEWQRIERGARISLEVVPRDDGRLWEARGLAARVKPQSCSNHSMTAVVAEMVPGLHLRVAGRDELFLMQDMAADAVTGEVTVGARILLHYADCGLGGLQVQKVRVLSGPGAEDGPQAPLPRIDIVARIVSIDRSASPVLATVRELPSDREWKVEVADGTIEGGGVADLASNMVVRIEAEVLDEGAGRLRALKLRLPQPSPTPPPPTATWTPAPPSATPTLAAPTPTNVAGLAPPEAPAPPIAPPSGEDES